MKFSFLVLLTTFCCFNLAKAQHKDFKLDWVNKKNIASEEGKTFYVPGFSERNFSFNQDKESIIFSAQWEASGNVSSSKMTDVKYEPIAKKYLKNLDLKAIPTKASLQLKSTRGRNKNYLVLKLIPIINDHGVYKKITSFRINYTLSQQQNLSIPNNVPTVSNSILASGNFYKFYVDRNGVFKISKSFLKSLGMDVTHINPQKLKIYGFGGEMLPLINSENTFYDPPEVPIQVVGAEDGSFDNSDYILFYGSATEGHWNEENKTNLNLYADYSYYYITADGSNGKRINPYTPPSGNASTTITTFEDRDYYEEDKYNIGKVGRRWFGDSFDVQNERSYDFNFPNIVSGSAIKLEVYGASTSETNTSLKVTVNDQDAGSLNFSSINDVVFARDDKLSATIPANADDISVKLSYQNNGNPASVAYLDYINISAKRKLIASNKQFKFYNPEAASQSGIANYHIENTANISQIWDLTNPQNITRIANENQGNTIDFKATLGEEKTYVAISPQDYYTPLRPQKTKLDNLNLKGTVFRGSDGSFQDVDYLIISPKSLLNQAQRLAQYRIQKDGLNVKVVLDQDIYEEFNSGKQDVGAIRNFAKYIYDNASSPAKRLKYLCLFGDASVDYKNRLQGNNNMIPTLESLYSYSLRYSSTASDDFFGMMDPEEGNMAASDKLDIAIGRIVADSPQMAKTLVDKTIDYESEDSFGAWRNNFILISDDADVAGDAGSGLEFSLDALGDEISNNRPFINVKKIHSDAYEQVYTSGGQRYPEVNKAINDNIEVGATVVNYLGHGGEDGLASEFIVTREDIKNWKNDHKFNLFITVTCEFSRFDNPLRVSPGELTLLNKRGGAVGMVSTIRTISVSTGIDFNNQLAPYLFNFVGENNSIAEAVRKAKNALSSSDRRVVFFFGDPAMHLTLPDPEIKLTAVNDKPLGQAQDTLKALSKIKVSGEVVSSGGGLLNNYNGILTATVFDKPIDRKTLGNDGTTDGNGNLIILNFKTLGNVVFRGKATVKNGKFDFNFVVPKDIKIPVGHGRISFYSKQNGILKDNKGYDNSILVGDINKNAPEDNKGPEIKLYMNDENFVSGGITDSSPMILAKLEDENGINTTSGIGHDIIAFIDGNETNPFVLNDYYQAETDSYQEGTVNYNLHDLEKGPHTLTFKAWDVYNNSSTAELQFVVADNDELKITHVLNYPNPFHDYTEFWFNHNRPFEPLNVSVQVFTVSGKLVWTKNEVINTKGFLSRDITWNGKDDFGDPIGKGVYIYKLTVRSTLTNQRAEKYEKLVIL